MEFFKPGSLKIDFVGKRRGFVVMSAVLVLLAIGIFTWRQATDSINWGIDFAGGTVIDLEFDSEVDIAAVRKAVTDLGYEKSVIQRTSFVGKEGQVEYMIRVERIAILSPEDATVLEGRLKKAFAGNMSRMIYDADSGDQVELRFEKNITEAEIIRVLKEQATPVIRTM